MLLVLLVVIAVIVLLRRPEPDSDQQARIEAPPEKAPIAPPNAPPVPTPKPPIEAAKEPSHVDPPAPSPAPPTPIPPEEPVPPPKSPPQPVPQPMPPPTQRPRPDREILRRIPFGGFPLRSTRVTADGKTMFTFSGGTVSLWDLPEGKERVSLRVPVRSVKSINDENGGTISSDGKTIAVLVEDTLMTVDVASRTTERYPETPHLGGLSRPVFLEDDNTVWVFSGRQRGIGGVGLSLNEWNVRDRKYKGLVPAFRVPRFEGISVHNSAFCAAKSLMAFFDSKDRSIFLFDIAAGNFIPFWKAPATADGSTGQLNRLYFSATGRFLFFEWRPKGDKGAHEPLLFDVERRAPADGFRFDARPDSVVSVAFTADEKRLLLVSDSGELWFYDLLGHRCLGKHPMNRTRPSTTSPVPIFTSDAKILVVSSPSEVVILDVDAIPLRQP